MILNAELSIDQSIQIIQMENIVREKFKRGRPSTSTTSVPSPLLRRSAQQLTHPHALLDSLAPPPDRSTPRGGEPTGEGIQPQTMYFTSM